MKAKLISCVALLSIAGSAAAAERAVEVVNGQVDLAFDFFDNEDDYYDEKSVAISETLHGIVNVPLGPYFGLSVGASFAKYGEESIDDDDDFEYEDDTLRGSAQIFYRNPSVGRVALGYARERVASEYTYNGYTDDETNTTYSYLALAEGYLGPVTIALHNERKFDDYGGNTTSHEDITWASVQWYVVPRVRIDADVGLKEAKDGFRAAVEFQPGFLGNMAGIYLGYAHGEVDEFETNGIRLGINFYFNSRVDLITRDRHYR